MYIVFGDMRQAQLVAQWVPYWSLPPLFQCSPGDLAWSISVGSCGWEKKQDTAIPKRHHPQVSRTGGILWSMEDRTIPHHPFCMCDGDLGGGEDGCTNQMTGRQSPFSLATFVLPSSPLLVSIATLSPVGLGAKWLIGSPRRQQIQMTPQATSSPWNLLNCDFQAKSSIFPQLKSGKDYETTWVRKTKGVFCNFARSTSRTTPKFQMCSSWMKGVHKSALQLKKGNCWRLLLFFFLNVYYYFLYWHFIFSCIVQFPFLN